jgi:hypothetical protein
LVAVCSLSAAGRHDEGTAETPVLTVCQALRDPARYEGMSVIVVGRSTGTMEGVWLDEQCGLILLIQGRSYPASISIAYVVSEFAPPPRKPAEFRWDKKSIRRALEEVKRTTRLEQRGSHWYAVYGRLETVSPRKGMLSGDRNFETYGYGHQGSAPAQLVWGGKDAWRRLR